MRLITENKRPAKEDGVIYVKGKADQQAVACVLLNNGYDVSYVRSANGSGVIIGIHYWTQQAEV